MDIPTAAVSLPSPSSPPDSATPGDSQVSGGGVVEQHHQDQRSQRLSHLKDYPPGVASP